LPEDPAGTEKLLGPALKIGHDIKRQIRDELGLVASVGIAPNKFLAKIASDLEKPDALVVVAPDRIQSFLDPLPVGRIWGVGKVSAESLRRISITTIGQLRQLPKETLIQLFGASGEHYWLLAQGIDERRVVPDREAKSISSETTFAEDIVELESLNAWLITLVEQVSRRLRNHSLKGRTVELKVRFSDFKSLTRSMTLEQSTDITAELLHAARELLEKRIPEKHLPVRLLGFGVSNFDQSNMTQLLLFDEPAREQQRSLDIATDEIAKKFGKGAIHRAATPKSPKDRSVQ
jgi:DNA polymerase-4